MDEIKKTRFAKARAAIADLAPPGDLPATYWTALTNIWDDWPGSYTYRMPQAGELYVLYLVATGGPPAALFEVWHEDFSTTTIEPGENTVAVGPNDLLVVQLADPQQDMIKFAFQIL